LGENAKEPDVGLFGFRRAFKGNADRPEALVDRNPSDAHSTDVDAMAFAKKKSATTLGPGPSNYFSGEFNDRG
jgi:hypothetical protein